MYDEWIQHTPAATTDEPRISTPKLHTPDHLKSQSPRSSLERIRPNVTPKPVPQRRIPELPTPDVPRRPKSLNNLRIDPEDEPSILVSNGISKGPIPGDLPPRPKSRNELDTLKRGRFGKGQGHPNKHRAKQVQSLKDELDFVDWYGDFEHELEDANNDEYRVFQLTLDSHLMTCNKLMSTTDDAIKILDDLRNSFQVVDAQTSSFQDSCANLVSKHSKLQELADSVATNLMPFTELEPITRALARPGSEFVRTTSFREMLARLDRCIEWMEDPSHQSFPDVEDYAPKFRHLMTRALTLIRNYYVSDMKEVAGEVQAKLREKASTESISSSLLYAKFRVNAPMLRELVGEIEKRSDTEEYFSLLEECYSCHSSLRQSLVSPFIIKRMNELSTSSTVKDLTAFARTAIGFMRGVCLDEFELFYAYFSGERSDVEVYEFLRRMCQPLFDHLRPKIHAEPSLIKLCELCFLIQTRYMRDLEDSEPEPFDRTQLDFGHLIQTIMNDTQSQITIQTHAIVRNEIEHFSPKPDDLDYPAKCQAARQASESKALKDANEISKLPRVAEHEGPAEMFDTETMFAGWYPTLRKCVWLLSKIYRLVNPAVFVDLAHSIVHSTTVSLITARNLLQKSKNSPVDAQLFLIRHLLQLKSQIVAFDIDVVPGASANTLAQLPPSAYPAITTSLANLRTFFSISGLLELVKTAAFPPAAAASSLDSKSEIDSHLRTVITEFTEQWADRMTAGIVGAGNRLAASDSPDPAARVKTGVEREVPVMRKKLGEYVEDPRIVESLAGAVFEAVLKRYEEYYDEMFTSKGKRPRNVDMPWDGEMFAEWAQAAFGLDKAPFVEDDEYDGMSVRSGGGRSMRSMRSSRAGMHRVGSM